METDLEILQKTFDDLVASSLALDQEAAVAMAGIKNKGEATMDLERWKDRKERIQIQIPLAESRLLSEQIRQLTLQRDEAKSKLEALRPSLEEAAADYDEKLKALQESYERHAMLQVQAWNAEQSHQQAWEDLQERKQSLRSVIRQVTGVEEVGPDGLSNTDNRLIRN
jgi:chromosome segregation ATPase